MLLQHIGAWCIGPCNSFVSIWSIFSYSTKGEYPSSYECIPVMSVNILDNILSGCCWVRVLLG